MSGNKKAFYFLLIPVLVWLLLLIIAPHIDLFINSFKVDGSDTFTVENY